MFEDLQEQAVKAFRELCEISHFRKGSLIVIGGSSSEIRGGHIGKDSSYEVGTAVVTALMEAAKKEGLALAFQCCEHLNRALIMERSEAEKRGYEEVTVVPWLHAGGAFSTNAFYHFKDCRFVIHCQYFCHSFPQFYSDIRFPSQWLAHQK